MSQARIPISWSLSPPHSLPLSCSLPGVLLTAGHVFTEEFSTSNRIPHAQVLSGLLGELQVINKTPNVSNRISAAFTVENTPFTETFRVWASTDI